MAVSFERREIPLAASVSSLCWSGDELIDVAAGLHRYSLDGAHSAPSIRFAFPFDAAIISPSGKYAAIYQLYGTKGVVVRLNPTDSSWGWEVREINRSYYHANVFEFPVAFAPTPAGEEVLVHCPNAYNRLELEEIESGKHLSSRTSESQDFFHSRLQVSPGGSYLLSAGWIWHPIEWISVYDLRKALADPTSLDCKDGASLYHAEIPDSAFLDDSHLVVWGGGDEINPIEPGDIGVRWGVSPRHLAVFDLATDSRVAHIPFRGPLGDFMAFDRFLVSFYEHPRLFDIADGALLHEWPDIPTNARSGTITMDSGKNKYLVAKDPMNRRFAAVVENAIIVITLT